MFGVKHHWLLKFSTANKTEILNDVEMYINADIHVAYPREYNKKNKNYTIEDVYNPAYGKGGELKRKIIGFYNDKDGYKVEVPLSKYYERKNMTNVILKTKVVVGII